MADSMTIDFLRARLLSERSVCRAARERTEQLARRVRDLEEQAKMVAAQRRKAETAAADVLAIFESRGLTCLVDSGSASDTEDSGAAATDDSSSSATGEGTTTELDAASPCDRLGRLSWKGRSGVITQQHNSKQFSQLPRRTYSHSPIDSTPKYRVGQSCRRNKKTHPRCSTKGEVLPECIGGNPGGSDDCRNKEDSSENCEPGDDGKEQEMERALEHQALLICHYEAEEHAQLEWEKRFSGTLRFSMADDGSRSRTCSAKDDLNYKAVSGPEVDKSMWRHSISGMRCLAAEHSSMDMIETAEGFTHDEFSPSDKSTENAVSVASHSGVDKLLNQSFSKFNDGNHVGFFAGRIEISANRSPEVCSVWALQDDQMYKDNNSDSKSSFAANSVQGNDTICCVLCNGNKKSLQMDLNHGQQSNDVGSTLEALQHAKLSLREKFNTSSRQKQQILALPAPHTRASTIGLASSRFEPPVSLSCLFRLPTSSIFKDHLGRTPDLGH